MIVYGLIVYHNGKPNALPLMVDGVHDLIDHMVVVGFAFLQWCHKVIMVMSVEYGKVP